MKLLDQARQHLRAAIRTLARSPGFATAAVLCLALGIGGTALLFTVVNAVILRPLPYPDQNQLVRLWSTANRTDAVAFDEYAYVRENARSLVSLAAYRGLGDRRIGAGELQEWVPALAVSDGFLATLATPPQLGRELSGDETRPGGVDAVVISASLWRRTFAGDPDVVGRAITLDDASFTVVGVLPDGFWFPQPVDVLIPLRRAGDLTDRGSNTQTVGRIRDGADLSQARDELAGMTGALRVLWAENRGNYDGVAITSFHAFLVGGVRLNLLLLFGATGLVFLIAVSNVAVMLLARFAARRKDLAVRLALGGGVQRIARQLLAENLVLTTLGAALGVAFAYASTDAFVAWLPLILPPVPVSVDRAVLAFVALATAGTVALLTAASVGSVRRLESVESLGSSVGRSIGEGRAHGRQLLTVAEVALSTVLLAVAGLLAQSLYQLHHQPLGFTPAGLVTFATPLAPELAAESAAREELIRTLTQRLREIPGIREVAAANVLPLTGDQYNVPSQRDGRPEFSFGGVEVRWVTASYFDAMGIPLVRGRGLVGADANAAAPVAVINETLARMWWPEGEAIGDRLVIGTHEGQQFFPDPSREVVGVVADSKTVGLRAAPRPTVFVARWDALPVSTLSWLARGDGELTADLTQRIRAAVDAVDPAQRVLGPRTMDEVVASAAGPTTFNAQLFGAFAALAVLLAAVGLYGVLSFLVGQRRREIGTRMALGATAGSVARRFLGAGLLLTMTGVLLGLGGALAVSRLLSAFLFEIEPHDPASFGAVAALLLSVGLLASYLPARRAAHTAPMRVLKGD